MLIGLTGYKGSGKSLYANAVNNYAEYVGAPCCVLKFAGALKGAIGVILHTAGIELKTAVEMIEGSMKETPHDVWLGRTTRHAMQTLGTEWGRECISPDLWTNIIKNKIKALRREDAEAVILLDDVRFANEAALIRELGGVTVRVERPGTATDTSHASEREVMTIPVDSVFYNVGPNIAEASNDARLHFNSLCSTSA